MKAQASPWICPLCNARIQADDPDHPPDRHRKKCIGQPKVTRSESRIVDVRVATGEAQYVYASIHSGREGELGAPGAKPIWREPQMTISAPFVLTREQWSRVVDAVDRAWCRYDEEFGGK